MSTAVVSFSDDLPETQADRRDTVQATANDVCEFEQDREELTAAHLRKGSKTAAAASNRLVYSIEMVNEWNGEDIPTRKAERLSKGVGTVAKYTPLIGSYNRYTVAACDVKDYGVDNETARRRFYLAGLMLAVDAALLTSGGLHKAAFRSTGVLTNQARKIGAYRLRYLCGNRCFALGMSELYGVLKAQMVGVVSFTLFQAGAVGIELSQGDVNWVEIAHAQGVSPHTVVRQLDDSERRKYVERCGKSILNATGDALGKMNESSLPSLDDASKAADSASDGVLGEGDQSELDTECGG